MSKLRRTLWPREACVELARGRSDVAAVLEQALRPAGLAVDVDRAATGVVLVGRVQVEEVRVHQRVGQALLVICSGVRG